MYFLLSDVVHIETGGGRDFWEENDMYLDFGELHTKYKKVTLGDRRDIKSGKGSLRGGIIYIRIDPKAPSGFQKLWSPWCFDKHKLYPLYPPHSSK